MFEEKNASQLAHKYALKYNYTDHHHRLKPSNIKLIARRNQHPPTSERSVQSRWCNSISRRIICKYHFGDFKIDANK